MTQQSLFDKRAPHFETFDQLVDTMSNMTDDPLHSAGTNMVIYRGNPAAKLMIVGEAPGTNEDRERQPFVGRSGQLLDKMLEAINFDSNENVFITNAVFRLPPGTDGKPLRKPNNQEIEYYKPYLLEIIRLIDPKILLLTGNVATQSLLGQTGITKLRGQWFEWDNRWLMPIFHPAYLLRNPSKKPGQPKALTWEDLQNARRKYDELGLP
ncbi:MAG TPA: uracil-DNA glycosylase [Anaerolineae bacterium]|nr:uracil-DNA glycosylase [Anaerolineae bacterium]